MPATHEPREPNRQTTPGEASIQTAVTAQARRVAIKYSNDTSTPLASRSPSSTEIELSNSLRRKYSDVEKVVSLVVFYTSGED